MRQCTSRWTLPPRHKESASPATMACRRPCERSLCDDWRNTTSFSLPANSTDYPRTPDKSPGAGAGTR
jgi:hypothetical protein